jgi:ankyrin repeat protein
MSLILWIPISGALLVNGCRSGQGQKEAFPASKGISASPSMEQGVSIHEAALSGNLTRVSLLLENGLDADTADIDGRTALMYAAFNGHSSLIDLLIRHGASVNHCDINGHTALMMAASGPFPDAVRLLLYNQANPNITDKEEHFTALMYAASEGQLEAAKLLLEYKADPFLKDIDNDNALNFARMNQHADVAALLESFMAKSRNQ